MIKAMAGTTLVIGISQMNVDLLAKDRPIKIDFVEMGIVGRPITDIVIYYGKDDQDLYNQIKAGIDPFNTIIHSDKAQDN